MGMLKSLLKGHAARRGARALPGGWLTVLALSPKGRSIVKSGWRELQKRRRR